MPSSKNPVLVVIPGPGKLPAGTVTASALLFPPGGGSGAALSAHVTDPVDAHMASAIGVNPLSATGFPILSTAGGTVDGESVLDFIEAAKDLFPIRPNQIGNNDITIPNSGSPEWYQLAHQGIGLGTTMPGGFTRGAAVVYTHHLAPSTTPGSFSVTGMIYPADRGVLALYYSATGDYTTGTLVAALWLGSSAPPAGIPTANFQESQRMGAQGSYTATGIGIDKISLQSRVPYLKDYATFGVPWTDFDANFSRYQVALYVAPISTIAPGDTGSWLLVHWREGYATSALAIAPAQLATHLTPTDCYSATTPNLDDNPGRRVNRHNVFVETVAASPSGVSFTTGVNAGMPVPTVIWQSGVASYNGNNLRFDIAVQASGLFNGSYYTGTSWSPNGPPSGLTSDFDPLTFDLTDFGLPYEKYIFSQLHKAGAFPDYSTANPPASGDTAELTVVNYTPAFLTPFTPNTGYGIIRAALRKPFVPDTFYADGSFRYLLNTYPQVGSTTSTDTLEPFNDEKYRYTSTYAPSSPAVPIEPAGGDHRDPTVIIAASGTGDMDAQIIGGRLRYPSENYSTGYLPINANYAAVFAADAANWIRRYMRAFNTGAARNTGRLRIRATGAGGFSQFQSNGPWTGNEVTNHTGGMIIQVKVPGATGWLDIGRLRGDPDLGTEDFKGCLTSVTTSGSDVFVSYNTTEYTVDNGSGKYPLFVRVSYIKGVGGGAPIEEIEWLAP